HHVLIFLKTIQRNSAMSALSWASSNSCCSLRNLARLVLASSSASSVFLNLLLSSFHSNLLCFIQTMLQILDGLLHVLLHLSFNVCLYLVELQLGAKDLALLMLQGALSLLKG
uniref:Uncharacterized protein n=1 Tax=Scleropages formosus TaxID=113540 RepID=A0A8C9S607_SCLFO